jgi:hypothetical protein
VSAAAVSKYVAKGLPVRPDGRLDWTAAEAWRAKFNEPTRSGSHRSRETAKSAAAAQPGDDTDFIVGFATARKNIRQVVPELIASMRPEGVEDRIATLAVIDHLLGAWLMTPANAKAIMPAIDWGAFTNGITPKRARDLFEALQADFEKKPTLKAKA